jgi:hypothetical protein
MAQRRIVIPAKSLPASDLIGGGDPVALKLLWQCDERHWVPAFAGTTKSVASPEPSGARNRHVIPAKAGIQWR